jgi:hypothetical protein
VLEALLAYLAAVDAFAAEVGREEGAGEVVGVVGEGACWLCVRWGRGR